MQKVASKSKLTITTLLIAMILVLVAVATVTTFVRDGGAVAQASAQVQTKTDSRQYEVVEWNRNYLSALSSADDIASDEIRYWNDNKDEDYYYFLSVTGKDFQNGNMSYVTFSFIDLLVFGFGFNTDSNSSTRYSYPFIFFEQISDVESFNFEDNRCSLLNSVILEYHEGKFSLYFSSGVCRLYTFDDYMSACGNGILLYEFTSSELETYFVNYPMSMTVYAGSATESYFFLERSTDAVEPFDISYDNNKYFKSYMQSAKIGGYRNSQFFDWAIDSNAFNASENSYVTYIVALSANNTGQLDDFGVWFGLSGGDSYTCAEHDDYCSKIVKFGSRYNEDNFVEHYLNFGHNYYPDTRTYEFSTVGDWDFSMEDNLYLMFRFNIAMSDISIQLSCASAYYWGGKSYGNSKVLLSLDESDFEIHPEYNEFMEALGDDSSLAIFNMYSFDNYDESDPFYYPEDYSISCSEHFYLFEELVSYVPDLEVPEREGYTFTGWYYDEECTQPYDGKELAAGQTLYPGWERITFTVFFDGSSLDSRYDPNSYGLFSWTATVGYGDVAVYEGMENPEIQVIFDFEGWYYENGTKYEGQAIYEDTHLYPRAFCTVYFETNGAGEQFESVRVAVGDPVELPTPSERKYYEFVGWYYGKELGEDGKEIKYYVYGEFIADRNTVLVADWLYTGRMVNFYVDSEYETKLLVEDGTLLKSALLTFSDKYTLEYLDYFVYQEEFYFSGAVDFDLAEFEIHDNIDIYLSSEIVNREPSGPTIADGDGENGEDKASGFAAKWTAFWNEVKAFFLRIRDWFIRVGQWFKNLFKRK